MPAITLTPGLLISLIERARTISDTYKEKFIAELKKGFTPKLQKELQRAFANEAKAIAGEIQDLDKSVERIKAERIQAEQSVAEESEKILQENQVSMDQIAAEFDTECTKIESEMQKGVEGEVRTEEIKEAEKIRRSLKEAE